MSLVDTKLEAHYYNGGVSMEKVPKGTYTKEFKEEAARMVTVEGLSVPEVGRRLSIPKSTIANWVKAAKGGTLAKVRDHENTATQIFSASSLPGIGGIAKRLLRMGETSALPVGKRGSAP
jgi:transposase